MEHSKNKIIPYFGNGVGLGVLQSRVLQTCALSEFQTTKVSVKNGQWLSIILFAFLQGTCLLKPGLEYSRSDLVSEQPRLHNKSIFEMLY